MRPLIRTANKPRDMAKGKKEGKSMNDRVNNEPPAIKTGRNSRIEQQKTEGWSPVPGLSRKNADKEWKSWHLRPVTPEIPENPMIHAEKYRLLSKG